MIEGYIYITMIKKINYQTIIEGFNESTNFKIILTGGYSHLFKDSLKFKVTEDKDITIKGLIKIIKDNKL